MHATGDCAPYGRRRDAGWPRPWRPPAGTLVRTGSPYAVSPGRVLAGGGGPYRVFTPFRRAWAAHGWPPPTGVARRGDVGPPAVRTSSPTTSIPGPTG